MDYKLKYKILAFTTLAKFSRKNSILQYYWESDSQCATRLNLNLNTYKKYKNICINNGFTKLQGKNIQIISLSEILIILNDGVIKERNLMFNRHLKFFKFCKYNTRVTFKLIYNQIVESILIKNFEQQQYNINFTKKLSSYYNLEDGSTRNEDYSKTLKLGRKLASKKSMSIKEYIDSTSKNSINNIVTGKYHSSNLIKMSASSSLRILKRMQNKQIISRFVKTSCLGKSICQDQIDNIDYKSGFLHISRNGNLINSIGSVIKLSTLSTSRVGIKK